MVESKPILPTNLGVPETTFLNTAEGTKRSVNTLLADRPIILSGGSMYGTVFLPHLRADIAYVRRETEPWETVSVLTTWSHAQNWIDYQHLHPNLALPIREGHLKNLTNLMFVRFPANLDRVDSALKQYCINSQNEIQVFFMPENYPLFKELNRQGINSLLVRSANIHNQAEALNYSEAQKYAIQIGAPLIVLNHPAYLSEEAARARVGGNNIIRFGPQPEAELLRQGNTAADTTQRLLSAAHLLPPGIVFKHQEAKPRPLAFLPYECPKDLVSLTDLTADLLKAGGLQA